MRVQGIKFVKFSLILVYSTLLVRRLNENEPDPAENDHLFVRGDDAWIGRVVRKDFPNHDIFTGRVTDVDDNVTKKDYRVFHVVYEDGDDEWIGAADLIEILVVRISTCPSQHINCMFHFTNTHI